MIGPWPRRDAKADGGSRRWYEVRAGAARRLHEQEGAWAVEPITWLVDDAREAAGITPGQPSLGGLIIVAEGEIDTPAYSGSVEVTIEEEWDGLLALMVCHDEDPGFDGL